MRELIDAIGSYENDVAQLPEVRKAINKLRRHLGALGPRAAGWNDVLELGDLEDRLKNEPERANQIRSALEYEFYAQENMGRQEFQDLTRQIDQWLAEMAEPLSDGLALDARAAKWRYAPIADAQLESARQKLQTAALDLENYLATGPIENAERWKKFLRWPNLMESLNQGTGARLSRLNRVYRQLGSGEQGLEKQPFVRVRLSLRGYLEQLQLFATEGDRAAASLGALRRSMRDLDAYLQTASQKREELWKEFLRWEDLSDLVDGESRNLRSYVPILRKLESETDGLDRAPFQRVALRLGKYMESLNVARGPSARERFDARLEQIARNINADSVDRSPATTAALLSDLEWLESYGQLPEIGQRLRSRFAQPNLQMRISAGLIARATTNRRQQTDPVGMCFYGSWVQGSSTGDVGAVGRLRPGSGMAVIDLDVSGTAVANTVGIKRRVQVFSRGDVNMAAQKRLFFDGFQITSQPTIASACSTNRTCGVSVNRLIGRRLIGRLARRRAQKLKPCAEQLSNCQAREKLVRQLDSQTDQLVSKANQQLADLRRRLEAQNLFPDTLSVNSTDAAMQLVASLASGGKFTAPNAAPAIPQSPDVLVQLHQSVINNLLASRMRGVKVDNESMRQRMEEMNIEVPELTANSAGEDKEEDEDENWSMQFDFTRPVSVGFDDGLIKIIVRGTNFTRGDQAIDDTIDIIATYQFVYGAGQLKVRRVGDVEIDFVGTEGQLSTRQIAYKTFLARRVAALFREQLSLDDLPAGEIQDQLRTALPQSLYAREGWLSIGINVTDQMLKQAGIGS